MKILHVIAYLSADGAYGGPASVALAQARGLAAHHDVTLVAGGDGSWRPEPDDQFEYVPVRSWRPSRSFGALFSPAMSREVMRRAAASDVVHVHMARDFAVGITARRLAGTQRPYVIQAHGMLNSVGGRALALYDRFVTRPVLERASSALVLTDRDARAIARISPGLRRAQIGNGVAVQGAAEHTAEDRPEVLFLARIHPRKHVERFIDMAKLLRDADVGCECVVVGPDGGDLDMVKAAIRAGAPIRYDGAIEPGSVLRRLRQAQVLVLPSHDDQFPMVVLEALSVGTPVVVDSTSGLVGRLSGSAGARVVDQAPGDYAEAVTDLLQDRAKATDAAVELAEREFSIEAVVEALEHEYAQAIGGDAP
ncbi:glycosyltransferase [Cellulomonas sp. PhB143]|uniref:glycosyltransferase n=1 Tax=Cellulomonas sp. PhB143 TaxID=2485186 RepID=UPI000F484501|nr:glycosyltransferase [Cellulomonas sp. PhB143]ROS78679.1 glycosyltransferase involved in cell wall biosynthesis [Cellulomonas sp. PhB143]